MAFAAVGLFLFTFLNGETTLEFIIINLIILGFGFALFSSPNTNAVMSSVDKRFYGIASATLGTMRLVWGRCSAWALPCLYLQYLSEG